MIVDEFVGRRGSYLGGNGAAIDLEMDFAGKLDFEANIKDVDGIGIDFHFLLDRHAY